MVNPIPEGYPRVTPYLIVDGAAAAIDFYTSVLGATERMRMGGPEGKVGHAELELGDSVIMLADEHPEMDARGPKTVGGSPVSLHVYVEDADSVRIYLYEGVSLKDSTRTTAGGYAFTGLRGGSYAVAADLWGGIGDTITVTNLTADVALDTLVLLSSATMPAFPNPFSTSTTVQFDISANSMVEMSARKPSGLVVNTLVQRMLPAGVHRVVWDGTDGASNPVPSGTYWILFRVGADYRARLVAKS